MIRGRTRHLRTIAGGLLVAVASIATAEPARAQERLWDVTCGLPQEHNALYEALPTGGYSGPWPGGGGHLETKTLNLPGPEGRLSTELWLLSRGVGWWRLKAIRVHPEDWSELGLDSLIGRPSRDIRQIIDSPFLPQPVVVRAGDTDDEAVVNGQILALLPDASSLRCTTETSG